MPKRKRGGCTGDAERRRRAEKARKRRQRIKEEKAEARRLAEAERLQSWTDQKCGIHSKAAMVKQRIAGEPGPVETLTKIEKTVLLAMRGLTPNGDDSELDKKTENQKGDVEDMPDLTLDDIGSEENDTDSNKSVLSSYSLGEILMNNGEKEQEGNRK